MNALLELDLDDNKLEDSLAEDSSALANLLTLRILRLNRNGMTVPPRAAISPLTSLQYLHLEGNSIQVKYNLIKKRALLINNIKCAKIEPSEERVWTFAHCV
jgi:Leucine-rich repeat (LRR) protein